MSSAIKEQVFTLSHIYLLDEMERRIKAKKKELENSGNPDSFFD